MCGSLGDLGMPFKILKDTLMQEAGIPTLVIDCDVAGPTYVLAEQMQRNAGETGRVS